MPISIDTKLKIGITGSTGSLGKKLTSFLMERGFHVRCLVRQTSDTGFLNDIGAELVVGDLSDKNALCTFVKNLDIAIHLAALVDRGTMREYRRANVEGTANLCNAILLNNRRCRIVYCSTIASLRLNKLFRISNTAYAISKNLAEKTIEFYSREHDLMNTIIYCGLIYGPGDRKLVPAIIKHLKDGSMFLVSGGEKYAPLVYIDDLCDLFLKVIVSSESDSKRYAGTRREEAGIHDFIRMIAEKTGNLIPKIVIPKHLASFIAIVLEGIYSLLCIRKSPPLPKRTVDVLSINFREEDYGLDTLPEWQARVSLEEGLDKTLSWYRTEYESSGVPK